MLTRTLSRWLMSVVFATLALVVINLLVATAPVQSRHAATLINCAGSIQACIDAANDGDTILVAAGRYTESLTLSKPVSLTGENRDTTIIHAIAGQRVLTVTGATITTSVVISGLTFTGGSADYGGGVLLTNDAHPLIRNSIFFSNTAGAGGGLYTEGMSLTLHDTDFIANVGGGASAYYAAAAQVIGGRFISNTGTGYYAALSSRSLEISGTQFIGNGGGYYAGGVEAYDFATIVNARFENNAAQEAGGLYFHGTYAYDEALVLSNTTFVNNAGGISGGVYIESASFAVINSTFERNQSTSTYSGGGALYAFYALRMRMSGSKVLSNTSMVGAGGVLMGGYAHINDSLFENNASLETGALCAGGAYLTNTQFISNAAGQYGGGINGGLIHLDGGRFERNTARLVGGGLYADGLVISGTEFISNTAPGGGGAWVWESPLEVTGGRFEGNRALESSGGWSAGGGLMAQYTTQVTISGTQFVNNATSGKGGGLYTYGPSRLVNTLFAGNSADEDGAAIYFRQWSETQRDLIHVTIADTSSNPQAAISVLSGTLNLTNTIIANHAIGISNTAGLVYEDYNLFFNVITNTVDVTSGGHSLIGDPKFVDPLHGDYRLQFDSAAIDHGVDAGVYTDLDGHPRPIGSGFDIGAYEFQGIRYVWLPLIRK